MSFTVSHAIAAFPLWVLSKKKLDLPALAVGAMIPDVTFFLHLRPVGNIGHSMWGVLVEGIPMSLILLLIFSTLMLSPLRALIPSVFGRLLPQSYSMIGVTRLAIIIVSITLGATSHILWDGFTHKDSYFVELWPILNTQLLGLPIYKTLQYGGAVGGLLAIALLVVLSLRNAPKYTGPRLSPTASKLAWALIVAVTILIAVLAVMKASSPSPYLLILQTVIGIVSGSWLGIFVYSVAYKLGVFTGR